MLLFDGLGSAPAAGSAHPHDRLEGVVDPPLQTCETRENDTHTNRAGCTCISWRCYSRRQEV